LVVERWRFSLSVLFPHTRSGIVWCVLGMQMEHLLLFWLGVLAPLGLLCSIGKNPYGFYETLVATMERLGSLTGSRHWFDNRHSLAATFAMQTLSRFRLFGSSVPLRRFLCRNSTSCTQNRSLETFKMVERWTFCIGVPCYPNLGHATIAYVLYNNASNNVFQRKIDICRRTTNNETYYISLCSLHQL